MFRILSFVLFILFSSVSQVSSETCSDGRYTYYCSRKFDFCVVPISVDLESLVGQTCGYSYGDCRGLSAYTIMGIVFGSITLLGICIRCCIYMNAPQVPRTIPVAVTTTPNGRVVRVRVRQAPNNIPVHTAMEEAPPSYAAATAPGFQGKY